MNAASVLLALPAQGGAGWQAAFAQALCEPALPPPAGLRAWNGSDIAPRFAVHRNNIVVSLTLALAETFPVVRQLVGEEFFAAMARCHIAAQGPRSPVLVEYGDEFAAWLERFEPAAGLPYLADMARLERARVRATHAAEAPPLSAAAIGARLAPWLAAPASGERLGASRLVLHPSLAVIRSHHAVVSLWAAHQGRGRIEDVTLDEPEAALVLRQGDGAATSGAFEVAVLPVSHATAQFVQHLADGETLAAATTAILESDPAFEPDTTLALLIAQGALVEWQPPGD